MNDVWYQFIQNLQQYIWWWIGSISIILILLWVYIYFPFNRKKKVFSHEQLGDLFQELKDSQDSVKDVFNSYQEIIEDKNRELQEYDEKILQRENKLLLISDLPDEVEVEIQLRDRKHNQRMLLIGMFLGGILGATLLWTFIHWERVLQYIL
ncbi:hypothetical protein KMW28_01370 [Flammeovirga yaeyamensis]|uniref:Uncharacterized protein n=1 Tax=Flammeovirga yaeyamensis TaxID=367791 RepID=A0AAX1N408_9BACT|nr:hypothetical protein [Flammeovirga yaeyamensis]MBB3699734.1 gas vesicle protein [Flammeovirga yaeyamensis]NMF36696.1 hypothetical protein [Flammeovirga yaeyamensis]QWG02260.1 hypothetical protein KMW28_01370 [Flammeovirga yaeyamensis]